jgi:DASS family divalent anion:Na+ symporter
MESFALHSLSTTTTTTTTFSTSLYTRISLLHRLPKPLSITKSSPSIPLLSTIRSSTQKPLFFSAFHTKNKTFDSKFRILALDTKSSDNPLSDSSEKPTPPQKGAKLIPLLISVSIGLIVRFAVPKPIGITPQAWQLLSIFLSTIAGLVLSPLPVGAWAFLGLTTSVVTRTLTFSTAFSAFTSEVIWLIVISFFFARGFVKTGLGDRIATYFVKWLGKSTLGLSYGLTLSEVLIAPAMPSTTARAGGVFLPIIKSLSLSAGSKPGESSSAKLGSYLIQSQMQVIFSLHFVSWFCIIPCWFCNLCGRVGAVTFSIVDGTVQFVMSFVFVRLFIFLFQLEGLNVEDVVA